MRPIPRIGRWFSVLARLGGHCCRPPPPLTSFANKPRGSTNADRRFVVDWLSFRRIADIPFDTCMAALESWQLAGHDGELQIGQSLLRGPIERDRDSGTCRIEVRLARGPLRTSLHMRLDIDRWSSSSTAFELIPCGRVQPTGAYLRAGHRLLDSLTHSLPACVWNASKATSARPHPADGPQPRAMPATPAPDPPQAATGPAAEAAPSNGHTTKRSVRRPEISSGHARISARPRPGSPTVPVQEDPQLTHNGNSQDARRSSASEANDKTNLVGNGHIRQHEDRRALRPNIPVMAGVATPGRRVRDLGPRRRAQAQPRLPGAVLARAAPPASRQPRGPRPARHAHFLAYRRSCPALVAAHSWPDPPQAGSFWLIPASNQCLVRQQPFGL
jgi:hypothetical protein